ncbi:MAG: hypothetical protein FJ118_11290 [Deltaproteobacteria bacterium]|nr:hypothetical protein [Deltaproteobacteria bacterium]
MNKGPIQKAVESMDPMEAASELTEVARELFFVLGEEALRDFLARLIGGEEGDKTIGLVHL